MTLNIANVNITRQIHCVTRNGYSRKAALELLALRLMVVADYMAKRSKR